MTVNVVRKPKFAAARSFVKDRFDEVINGKITINDGGNGTISDKKLCIMQAHTYILGYNGCDVEREYAPPCTSEMIREFMINLNDSLSDRKRAKLVSVLEDIVNTAPMKVKISRSTVTPINITVVTDELDPDYQKAEDVRSEMIDKWQDAYMYKLEKISMTKINAFIRKLAAVAKFDTAPSSPTVGEIDAPSSI